MAPEEVKALRLRLGLSQEALARKLGCSLRAVSSWERANGRGMRRPTGPYLKALLKLREETGK